MWTLTILFHHFFSSEVLFFFENETCYEMQACHLQQRGNLVDLVDPKLGSGFNKEEVERVVKVAVLCTNASPSLRPTMSEAVSMLEGHMSIPVVIPEANSYAEDLRFKAMREFHQEQQQNYSFSGSQTQNSTTNRTGGGSSSTSIGDLYEISLDSKSS